MNEVVHSVWPWLKLDAEQRVSRAGRFGANDEAFRSMEAIQRTASAVGPMNRGVPPSATQLLGE